jgi:hypothetical protein
MMTQTYAEIEPAALKSVLEDFIEHRGFEFFQEILEARLRDARDMNEGVAVPKAYEGLTYEQFRFVMLGAIQELKLLKRMPELLRDQAEQAIISEQKAQDQEEEDA